MSAQNSMATQSNNSWDSALWFKVVDQPTNRLSHTAYHESHVASMAYKDIAIRELHYFELLRDFTPLIYHKNL